MTYSVTSRLTLINTVIITAAIAVVLTVLYRSTSEEFVRVERERDFQRFDPALVTRLAARAQQDFEAGGWEALGSLVRSAAIEGFEDKPAFLIVDEVPVVRVTTAPIFMFSEITQFPSGAMQLQARLVGAGGDTRDEVNLFAASPRPLRLANGKEFGTLVMLPDPPSDKRGRHFAASVWRSAAVALGAVLLAALLGTALVLRRSLGPIERLTRAAKALAAGQPRQPLQAEGGAEFAPLIDAFNGATAAIERTDTIRRELIRNIAHELRTPITNVRAQAEALQAGLVPRPQEAYEALHAETRVLARLVEDFQQLAVSDAGQLRVHLQDVPLADTLERMMGPMAEAAEARLEVEIAEHLSVCVDEERLRQVLANLMENAARYRKTGLLIRLTAEATRDTVTLFFEDNGPGVAEPDRARIFERFYRADRSRNRATGGSGLGLAIVTALLEAMHGSIRYVHRDGAGAIFAVQLLRTGSASR